ncbi:MAG: hypothetical protein ACRC6X_06615 [Culicoidibacterales bacterium]
MVTQQLLMLTVISVLVSQIICRKVKLMRGLTVGKSIIFALVIILLSIAINLSISVKLTELIIITTIFGATVMQNTYLNQLPQKN